MRTLKINTLLDCDELDDIYLQKLAPYLELDKYNSDGKEHKFVSTPRSIKNLCTNQFNPNQIHWKAFSNKVDGIKWVLAMSIVAKKYHAGVIRYDQPGVTNIRKATRLRELNINLLYKMWTKYENR